MRHLRWLQALLVVTVMVLLGAREADAQQRVLFYGPGGADASSFFGSGAAVNTVASAATWRSMTSADFGSYDQIWVEGLQCSNNSALYDTLVATRNVWGPIVTGRVVFNHADEDHHAFRTGAEALQAAQSQLMIRNSFAWLRTGRSSEGGRTSMYFSTGCLVSGASPSFLSNSLADVFGPGFTDNFAERNAIAITAPGLVHPVSLGLTIPGLQWDYFCHGGIPTFPTGFTSLVTCASPGAGEPTASGLIVRDALPPCPVTTGQCVPAVPVVITPADGSTTTPRPTITGTATPGSTVNVFIDGVLVGTTTATAGGTFSLPLTTNLTVGMHAVRATATQTGISSLPSNTNNFRVVGCSSNADCSGGTPICDTTTRVCRPCAVITQAADCPTTLLPVCSTFSPTTGACVARPPVVVTPANGSTTGNRPAITGTAPVGTPFVTVIVDGVTLGTVPVDASGNWSITPTAPLAPGMHNVFAVAIAGGLPSAPSNTNSFRVASCTTNADCSGGTPICDVPMGTCRPCATATMASDCPGATRPLCSTTGETAGQCVPTAPVVVTPANGSTTASQRPAITGTAVPGSTVTVSVDGVPIGTTTADPSGNWSFTPTTSIPLGMHSASATASVGGVRGPVSNTNNFRIVGCTTNADCSGGTPICDTTMGVCRPCTIPTMAADCTDPARPVCSNVAPTAGQCVPAAPTITTPANGSTTSNARPPITGTAPPGSTVTVSIDGVPVGMTTADPSGNFTLTPPMSLTPGMHTVSATDTLGGVPSASSPTNTFRVVQCSSNTDCSGATPVCNIPAGVCRPCATATADTDCAAPTPVCSTTGTTSGQCVPTAPTVVTPADGSTTANPRVPITGTSAPNIPIVVYLDGVEIGRTMSDPSGRWTFVPSADIPVGMHRATAAGANPTGGIGPQSPANNFRVVQCVMNSDCTGASVCDTTTNTCRGCTTNADCSGSTPICDTASRVCRPCAVATMATDCTDTMRPVCSTTGMTMGQCVPTAPVVVTPANGSTTANQRPVITGTSPPGAMVVVYVDGVEVGRATADGTGNWTFTPTANLGTGPHNATAAISTSSGVGPMSPANMFRIVQCLVNADCPGMAMCVVATNTCSCASNADCPVNTPICDTMAPRVCRPCAVATMATDCPDMARPVCATTGPNAGQCVGRSPVVLTPADGSTTSSPRPPITGTAPADSTVVVYVDGVEVGRVMTDSMGRWSFTPTTDIPRGMHTVAGAIATGTTVGPQSNPNTFRVVPCTMDAECANPTPVCDTGSGNCVVCTTGAMGNAMACTMNNSGHACQRPGAPTTAFCGCTMASDCPTDRRCDTAMSLCVPSADGGADAGDAGDATVDASDANDATADASDASDAADAPADVATDAGLDATAPDAGEPTLNYQGGGCVCHTSNAGSSSRGAFGLFAAMLALGAVRRRKRS